MTLGLKLICNFKFKENKSNLKLNKTWKVVEGSNKF